MDLIVSESNLGSFVPKHLLLYQGDPGLESYFRQILEKNYEKGVSKLNADYCQICYARLIGKAHPHIKPGLKMTRKIKGLLKKSESKALGKCHNHILQRYLNSSSLMLMKCSKCQSMNNIPIMTNEMKCQIKERLCKTTNVLIQESVTNTNISKKKRKKKKNKKVDPHCGLVIPTVKDEQAISANFKDDYLKESCSTLESPPSKVFSMNPSFVNATKGTFENSSNSSDIKKIPKNKKTLHFQANLAVQIKEQKNKRLKQFLLNEKKTEKSASLTDFLSSL
ncbi:uncharacterized protein LOC131952459 [Physella acuta]|uniref:uncharacterized protein LOC131952459 n=1 Tax=Physella acuta TaxID=109671 RepID=UPI0027DB48E9|nr:uncharacterized protein LOC131952459 [Physella acuta]